MRWITLFLRWLEAKRLGRSKELGETLGKRRKSVWTDNARRVAVVEARSSRLLDAMDFLLEHPRRVYTLMFRATETRWIFLVNVGMCFFGFLIYLILEWNNSVTIGIPERNWDFWFAGWFQESNVRNTGMAIFDLNAVSPGLLIYCESVPERVTCGALG
jgi:Trk-type K+ transport system membrane component